MYCLSAVQPAALALLRPAAVVDSSPSDVANAILVFFCVSMRMRLSISNSSPSVGFTSGIDSTLP